MKKLSFVVLVLIAVLCAVFTASSALAATLFSETFGTGTDYTTSIPGWTKSALNTSGRDDQQSQTGGSDGNYYAFVRGGTPGNEYIERSGISTIGYHNIKIQYSFNLYRDFSASKHMVVLWKKSNLSQWNVVQNVTGLQDWNTLLFSIPGAENSMIDIRFMEEGLSSSDFILVDSISITGASIALCGNNVVDAGEQCDDGNQNNDDECTNVCTLTRCGDGVVQQPNGLHTGGPQNDGVEACDDGNLNNDDGCNNNCIASVPVCGNGALETGEQCDDGNTANGDGCSSTCQLEQQGPVCGNNVLEQGEQCDSQQFGGQSCFSQGFPGGGILSCTSQCTFNTSACISQPGQLCGNGIINPPNEVCDGSNLDDQSCLTLGFGGGQLSCNAQCGFDTSSCYRCGDGQVNPGEQCDDGNTFPNDACTGTCQIAVCGDGVIRQGVEECDDGNTVNGDGCSASCVLEQGDLCTDPIDVMFVFDRSGSMINPDPQRLVDAKAAVVTFINLMNFSKDTGGLASFNESATLDQQLTHNKSLLVGKVNALIARGQTNIGDGIILGRQELIANGGMNKVMILLSDGAPNVYPGGFCNVAPTAPTNCTEYAVDQAAIAKAAGIEIFTIGLGVSNFTQSLLQEIATDPSHFFNAPNSSDLNSIYLQIAQVVCPCGDEDLDIGEECDDGNDYDYDACTNQCTEAYCGDGINHIGIEQCDDGNLNNNDLCTNACTLTYCGDGIVQLPNGLGNGGPNSNGFEQCDDGNSNYFDSCLNNCVVNVCGDGYVNIGVEECDDGNNVDNDGCSALCESETICGNGILEPGEQCDDGNTINEDGCSAQCLLEFCGDGVLQVGLGEQCDDGNLNNNDQCTNACTLTYCGDALVQSPNGAGTGGPANDGFEQCDDGNQNNFDSCLNTCVNNVCGDGILNIGVEQCDDGNTVSGDGCSAECFAEFCGDGVVQPGLDEQCELPSTQDNAYCAQSTQVCAGNQTGVRDAFGSCDGSCGCVADPFVYSCIADSCGAQCGSNDDCDDGNTFTLDVCDVSSCGCRHLTEPVLKDAKVSQALPTSNFGLGQYMMVNPKVGGRDRSYLRFDARAYLGQTISQADMTLTVYQTGNGVVGSQIDAYFCPNHDFGETTINWNNQPLDGLCTIVDTLTVTNTVSSGSPLTMHTYNLLSGVQTELSSGDGLFTIVLRSAHENDGITANTKFVQYLTKEYADPLYRPSMQIG